MNQMYKVPNLDPMIIIESQTKGIKFEHHKEESLISSQVLWKTNRWSKTHICLDFHKKWLNNKNLKLRLIWSEISSSSIINIDRNGQGNHAYGRQVNQPINWYGTGKSISSSMSKIDWNGQGNHDWGREVNQPINWYGTGKSINH